MKFFGISQHVAVIEDLKMIFNHLGHTIDCWNMSGHNFIFGRETAAKECPMLAGENWNGFIDRQDWDKFTDLYGEKLSEYDGFICDYPPVFSLLYQKIKKPIIIHIPIRYDYGVWHEPEKIDMFNEYLLNGNIWLTANNKYDKYYTEAFIDKEVRHIPSLCMYTGMQYKWLTEERKEDTDIIYWSSYPINNMPDGFIRRQDALPGVFKWDDVAKYKAVLHYPYQISSMTIFEHYSASMPMIFPSIDLMHSLYFKHDRKAVLEHVSHNNLYSHKSESYGKLRSHVKYDPNDYKDSSAVKHWLKYADYYDSEWMPHIQYFHNEQHLELLRDNSNWSLISCGMRYAQNARISKVLNEWSAVLNEIKDYVTVLNGVEAE